MPRSRGRVSAAASFFGFHANGRNGSRLRAEERTDEPRDEARRARRAAAPDHGDDGVPEDEQFGKRCDTAEDDDYMKYDDPHDDEGMPESRRRARRARRAEEDGYGRYQDEDDSGDRDARRAEAGDEDDDDAEMRGRSAVAAARRRERARCEAILTSRQAAANPELAFSLAFETSMTRQEALRALAKAPAAPAAGRSARNPNLGAGGERSGSSTQAIQAGWGQAFAKVGATRSEPDQGWGRAFAGQR
jgi:hypothetical protein